MVSIAFTGDVMLGRLVNEHILFYDEFYPFGDMLTLVKKSDLSIINLECVIAESGEMWDEYEKAFYFKANPFAIKVLKAANISYVSLANNHTLDFKEEAMLEMLRRLGEAGIAHAGAGKNLEDAAKPAFIESKGMKVGVLSFTDNEPAFAAKKRRPGTNYIPITLDEEVFGRVESAIKETRKACDLLVFSIHWGPNMRPRPSSDFVDFAHAVMDAGADIFHGHSAHIFQGIEVYKGKPIMYDTGDFIDDYYVGEERNDQTFLFLAIADKGGVRRIELIPALISRCQVNRAIGIEAKEICGRMAVLSEEMGTGVAIEKDGDYRCVIHL